MHKFLIIVHRQMRNSLRFLGPTVGTSAIVEQNGQILLVRRTENNKLDVPGGLVRWGETLEQGCQREVKEETGYSIEIVELLGVYSWIRKDYSNISVCYVGRIIGGEPRGSSEGEPLWAHPPFRAEDFHAGMDRLVFDYLADKRYVSTSATEKQGHKSYSVAKRGR